MSKFTTIANKFKKLPNKMDDFLQEAFTEFDSVAEDLNIDQLEDGKRADGTSLPDYSPVSVAVYGKPAGAMTLRDTGAFHKSIKLKADKTEANLYATDPKTDYLKDMYGDEIIGLNEGNVEVLKNDYIRPSVKENIERFVNG